MKKSSDINVLHGNTHYIVKSLNICMADMTYHVRRHCERSEAIQKKQ